MLELVRKLDDELKHKVADCAAFFEHRLQVTTLVKYFKGTFMCTATCPVHYSCEIYHKQFAAEVAHAKLRIQNSLLTVFSNAGFVGDSAQAPSTSTMSTAILKCFSSVSQEGQKAIFHLEAFVARFMSDYKTWTIQAFG